MLRGKWVMEVLLGTPPPPPPMDGSVPSLDETKEGDAGRPLTTRERMELHRKNPTCNSCHRFIDPIGLALDSFDVTGKWRARENGMPLDTRGEFYDGTPVVDARGALGRAAEAAGAAGAHVHGKPDGLRAGPPRGVLRPAGGARAFRRPRRRTTTSCRRFILGVVKSDAFRMKMAEVDNVPANTRKDSAGKKN